MAKLRSLCHALLELSLESNTLEEDLEEAILVRETLTMLIYNAFWFIRMFRTGPNKNCFRMLLPGRFPTG